MISSCLVVVTTDKRKAIVVPLCFFISSDIDVVLCITLIINTLVNRDVTYEDLYYTYILKHELAIQHLFKDKPYARDLFRPLGLDANEICRFAKKKEFIEICQIWCDIEKLNREKYAAYLPSYCNEETVAVEEVIIEDALHQPVIFSSINETVG
jgi:hypothetical protein